MNNRDSGLQPERTAISWIRTYLVLAINGIALIHISQPDHNIFIFLCGFLLLLITLLLSIYCRYRFSKNIVNFIVVCKSEIATKVIISWSIFLSNVVYIIYISFNNPH